VLPHSFYVSCWSLCKSTDLCSCYKAVKRVNCVRSSPSFSPACARALSFHTSIIICMYVLYFSVSSFRARMVLLAQLAPPATRASQVLVVPQGRVFPGKLACREQQGLLGILVQPVRLVLPARAANRVLTKPGKPVYLNSICVHVCGVS